MKPLAWRRREAATQRPSNSRKAQGRGPVGFEQEARAAWDRVVAAQSAGLVTKFGTTTANEQLNKVVQDAGKSHGLTRIERQAWVSSFSDARLDDLPISLSRDTALGLLPGALSLWDDPPKKDRELTQLVFNLNGAAALLAMAERADLAPAVNRDAPRRRQGKTFEVLQGAFDLGALLAVSKGVRRHPTEEISPAALVAALGYAALATDLSDLAGLPNPAEKAVHALVGLTRLEHNGSLEEAQRIGVLPNHATSGPENRRMLSVLLECVQKSPSEDPLLAGIGQSDWLDARIREISLLALFANNEAHPLLREGR